MSTDEIKLNKVTLKETDTGKDMVIMKVPEGWTSVVTTDRNSYRGNGQPFFVKVRLNSGDGRTSVWYLSGLHYRDDHMESHQDFTTDLYGNLYRKFLKVEDYIELLAKADLDDVTDLKFVRQTDWSSNAEEQEKLRRKRIDELTDPMQVVDRVYRKGAVREYSFQRNGYKRRRVYSAVIQGVEYAAWKEVPWAVTQYLTDPFMQDIAQMGMRLYPNAQYDKTLRKWIYTTDYYTDWGIRQILIMDAPESEFDRSYKKVFLPLVNFGVGYTENLRAEADQMQAERSSRDRKKRAEIEAIQRQKQAEADKQRAAEEEKRKRDQEAREKLRQTQNEIADIRRSMYENSQKTQAKVREMWTDTFRGDTRFVDKYGDEHVIHTYDNYAYKSGDRYVTSDSPLDHGWDWEELEKKKY